MKIVEITGRARQGRTEPFVCRGSDARLYFVKGRHAGYHSMICEWIAGRLAQELGLPVAPFTVVNVPEELVKNSFIQEVIDLGKGEAFGSQEIEFASQLQWSQIPSIDSSLRARILVFDWWIANSDRILGEVDGNVNLLWTNSPDQLHLIDHNLAFSQSVLNSSWAEFCSNHVFGQCWQDKTIQAQHLSGPIGALEVAAATSPGNSLDSKNYVSQCHDLQGKIDVIWDELPEKWQDNCQTLTVEGVKQILGRTNGLLW